LYEVPDFSATLLEWAAALAQDVGAGVAFEEA
jgi:hypothetical protein